MQNHLTTLETMLAVPVDAFSDAQFVREPRLRLLQRAFHDWQRTRQRWAEIGVFGAQGLRMTHPAWKLAAVLADARLPRATLHDYQALQVDLALALASQMQTLVGTVGMAVSARAMASPPQWCDLAGDRLASRVHLEDGGVWLLKRFDAREDADLALARIAMVVPRGRAQAVPVTCKVLPCTTAAAHARALERAELGRWALRQPAYCPAAA